MVSRWAVLLGALCPTECIVCDILGAPNQVSYNGHIFNLKVSLKESKGTVSQTPFVDPIEGEGKVGFRFAGQLTEAINPRLCGWAAYENFARDRFISSDALDRAVVGPRNGMPQVSCAEKDEKNGQLRVGRALGSLPMFYRSGQFGWGDHGMDNGGGFDESAADWRRRSENTDSSRRYPLCGDARVLAKDQWLFIDGSILIGSAKMLHCQLGNSTKFEPVGLFHVDCSKAGSPGPYDAVLPGAQSVLGLDREWQKPPLRR